MILPKSFYKKSTIIIAQELLGCFLIRKKGKKIIKTKIIETEAYKGLCDKASHASRGRTKRNSVMFKQGGKIYVYFTYGMHYMLNIVTEKENYPAAVLIRAVEPLKNNLSLNTSNGPAKLTKYLSINNKFNNLPIYTKKYGLWIEKGKKISNLNIAKRTRVGVDYAKDYKYKKWRFYIKGNKFISKK